MNPIFTPIYTINIYFVFNSQFYFKEIKQCKNVFYISLCIFDYWFSWFFCIDPNLHLYYIPSAWRTSLRISYSAVLLIINFLRCCLCEKVLISFLFLKDTFAGHKNLVDSFYYLLICTVSYMKSSVIIIFLSLYMSFSFWLFVRISFYQLFPVIWLLSGWLYF